MGKLWAVEFKPLIKWNKFYCVVAMAFSITMPSASLSQSYSAGYNKYVQGDFEGAEKSFQITLNKRLTTAEKARIYKMLGISQYMQGKRIAAESSFQKAKGLNPYINISPSEVLDESVVTFFNTIQAPKGPKLPPSSKSDATAQETYLKVYANPSFAQVAVDGVNLGRAGGLIKVSPGFHKIEVSAKNYKTHSQPIDVKQGQVNNITINLVKGSESAVSKPAPVKTAAPPAVKKDRKVKKVKKRRVAKPKQMKKVRKKRKRVAKSGAKEEKSMTFPHFLPFGVGQYLNDDTVLGVASSTLQAFGFGYGTYLWFFVAGPLVDEANSDREKMEVQRDLDFPDPSTEAWQQRNTEIIKFSEDKDAEAESIYQQSFLMHTLAGTVWLASVIQAYVRIKAGDSNSSARTVPKRRFYLVNEEQTEFFRQRSHIVKPNLTLDIKPNWTHEPYQQPQELGILLDIKLEF